MKRLGETYRTLSRQQDNSHGRRNFVDVVEQFPAEVQYVLECLKKVYQTDAQAKQQQLSPKSDSDCTKHRAARDGRTAGWLTRLDENGSSRIRRWEVRSPTCSSTGRS